MLSLFRYMHLFISSVLPELRPEISFRISESERPKAPKLIKNVNNLTVALTEYILSTRLKGQT